MQSDSFSSHLGARPAPARAAPLVISVCGPSGSGKSRTALALVTRLGRHRSVRIPADHYLLPATVPLDDYFQRPLAYDWPLLEQIVSLPIGVEMSTPRFDFETFQRIAESGGQPFTLQSICIVDAMYPCPFADIIAIITAPPAVRRTRIAERDRDWGSDVLSRWEHLEICASYLDLLDTNYDLRLSGLRPVGESAAEIARFVSQHL